MNYRLRTNADAALTDLVADGGLRTRCAIRKLQAVPKCAKRDASVVVVDGNGGLQKVHGFEVGDTEGDDREQDRGDERDDEARRRRTDNGHGGGV